MKRTRWLLIGLLVLANAGCARRDWVSDLLVLTDVTGTWEGSATNAGANFTRGITMVLQQRGPKVTGQLSGPFRGGELEGVVNGEVLSFSRGPMQGELTVDEDEMTGTAFVPTVASFPCPCKIHLRRERSRVPTLPGPPARRGQ
jgi:hypothetical protein